MRKAFIETLEHFAEKDEKIIVLTADLGFGLFENFKKKFPNRFVNVGIAEQNMIGVACGLASKGFYPFVYSIAPFATLRCLEQVKVDACYNKKNIVIVGAGGGLSYGFNGPTHFGVEDIAVTRIMPGMTVYAPGDPNETIGCVSDLCKKNKLAYLRLGRGGEKNINDDCSFKKINFIHGGRRGVLLTTGNMLETAEKVSDLCTANNMAISVVSVPCLNPIDKQEMFSILELYENIFTLEEHISIGGLGSIISEYIVNFSVNAPWFDSFSLPNTVLEKVGDQEYLRDFYGLTAEKIYAKIKPHLIKV